jgi:hypothetical protein
MVTRLLVVTRTLVDETLRLRNADSIDASFGEILLTLCREYFRQMLLCTET